MDYGAQWNEFGLDRAQQGPDYIDIAAQQHKDLCMCLDKLKNFRHYY